MINNNLSANSLRLGTVTHVYPEGQKFDVIYLDNGETGREIKMVTPYGGTDFGFTGGIPVPDEEGIDANKKIDPDKRNIIAVVAMIMGRPFCLGLVFPEISQMAFTKENDHNRMIERHTSDFYRTTDSAGNMDMVHPSGAFIRIGEGNSPTDLSQRDVKKRWKIGRNIQREVAITLGNTRRQKYGRSSFISLNPNGSINIKATRGVNIEGQVKLNGSIESTGNVDAGTGSTGTFTTGTGTTVQVRNGVITSIA